MAKTTAVIYSCTKCDAQSPKWLGQCATCGGWGTLTQTTLPSHGRGGVRPNIRLEDIPLLGDTASTPVARIMTGIAEFDTAIGGGIVPGSLLLLAGEPGVGKSTLVLQVAAAVASKNLKSEISNSGIGGEVLYVTGEETAEQVLGRAKRLGIPTANIRCFATTDGGAATTAIARLKPRLAIVDSIQTLAVPEVPVDAGGVTQVRTLANLLLATAKTSGIPTIVTGHVTKDGAIAGPKTLEHLVDQVAVLEGEPTADLRILRTTKNRFGPTDVVGVFTMTEHGFIPCPDPAAAFCSGGNEPAIGSAVAATTFGNRVLLAEVQALVTRSSFGQPQRRCVGVDVNRLHILLAVLSRYGRVNLSTSDVHVATVGGFRIEDPAADLAIAAALISGSVDRALPFDICIGEIGLDGTIRPVRAFERRVQEAVRLGRKRIAAPPTSAGIRGAALHPITTIRDLATALEPTQNS
ncbi:DNA repair protein RadA [Candidatus Uhrbacteria bacterium]|nr:DNA repair protein RadA [Candidatus Uhrbacteria bacterium]